MTEVRNLRSGEVRVYSLALREALVAAFAQERNDWETWAYESRYADAPVVQSGASMGLGDWATTKKLCKE